VVDDYKKTIFVGYGKAVSCTYEVKALGITFIVSSQSHGKKKKKSQSGEKRWSQTVVQWTMHRQPGLQLS
jgi:hypothetical protein